MKNEDGVRWTIDDLRQAVAAALGEGYDGPPNARVRDVPDERTIRYYTTLGLIDRAAVMRGRTALYGTRHLLQLVAIKKLQAQGLSLAEVQQALVGQPSAAIARIAGLSPGAVKEKRTQQSRARGSFWKETPAPARKSEVVITRGTSERAPESRTEITDRPQQIQGIQLAPNVTLLVAGSRLLEDTDLAALRLASSALIEILTKLEIIPPREEGDPR
jgi:DNA-binding transcriptional MerR regulator